MRAKDPEEFCSCRLQQWEMAFISINILVLTPCQVFSKGISKLWVFWQPPQLSPFSTIDKYNKTSSPFGKGKVWGGKILLCLIHFGWASVIFTRGQDLTGTSYFQAWWWKKWYWIYMRGECLLLIFHFWKPGQRFAPIVKPFSSW